MWMYLEHRRYIERKKISNYGSALENISKRFFFSFLTLAAYALTVERVSAWIRTICASTGPLMLFSKSIRKCVCVCVYY